MALTEDKKTLDAKALAFLAGGLSKVAEISAMLALPDSFAYADGRPLEAVAFKEGRLVGYFRDEYAEGQRNSTPERRLYKREYIDSCHVLGVRPNGESHVLYSPDQEVSLDTNLVAPFMES